MGLGNWPESACLTLGLSPFTYTHTHTQSSLVIWVVIKHLSFLPPCLHRLIRTPAHVSEMGYTLLRGQVERMVGMTTRSQAGSCLYGLGICGKPFPSPTFAAWIIIQSYPLFPRVASYDITSNTHIFSLSLPSFVFYPQVQEGLRRNTTWTTKWQEERSSSCRLWERDDNFVAVRKDHAVWLDWFGG